MIINIIKYRALLITASLLVVINYISIACNSQVENKAVVHAQKEIQRDSLPMYSPLEIEGRDIYIREGCYNCHSTSNYKTAANGDGQNYPRFSNRGEFVYDHPFTWNKDSNGGALDTVSNTASYYYNYLINPRLYKAQSIMPQYPWLVEDKLDTFSTRRKITALRDLGIPYPDGFESIAIDSLQTQAKRIAYLIKPSQNIENSKLEIAASELIALVAFLIQSDSIYMDFKSDEND